MYKISFGVHEMCDEFHDRYDEVRSRSTVNGCVIPAFRL